MTQNDTSAPASPAPATPAGRGAIAKAVDRLRAVFPGARTRKTVLKAAIAPLLMTTALSSDVVQHATPQTVVWGHGSYSAALAARASTFINGEIAGPGETAPPPPMRCYRAQHDERHPLLTLNSTAWHGFYELSRSGPYSRALHQSARDLELSICETSDSALVRNYDALNRLAGIRKDAALPVNIREAAHGIVHALMQQRNLSAPSADETLFSRLNRHLTGEAVALTAEYVVAAETAAEGDASLMRSLEAENHPALRYFQKVLDGAQQRQPGKTPDAIDEAAGATISFLLRQHAFIEVNSDIVLRAYLAELASTGPRPRHASDFDSSDLTDMGKIGRRSFSGEARLLSQQELAVVAPDIGRMVEAMERMHARRNHYPAPRARIADNPYLAVTTAAVQGQLNTSGGVYTIRQAFERASTAATYRYDGRAWQVGETFRYGMQADYTLEQTPEAAQALWEQIARLRTQSPTIGPSMLAYATRANIVMCYGQLGPNLLGQWQPDNGIIVMAQSRRGNTANTTRTVAHELLHLMQNAADIGSYTRTYSIEDMQISSLTREAAASTLSVLIALEFKLSGDVSLWDFGDEQPIAERMLQVYDETRAAGANHNDSLEAAGLEGFQMMFRRQWWQDVYNEGVARTMVERIATGWFAAPGTARYPLDKMRLSGRVSDAFNFTRNLGAAPASDMLFGANDDMRSLFAYLNLQQLQRNLGPRHESVVAQRNLMQENNNPYIDVDFNELAARYNADKTQSILHIANYLSGRAPQPLNLPPPQAAPAPAPRAPACGGS